MSASISKVGDVVIVTQLLPRGHSAFPLQLPAAAAAAAVTTIATRQATPPPRATTPPIKMDAMTASFLQGRPLSLGVVQIFLGLLLLLFSLTSALSHLLLVHAPFCIAVVFVASGAAAVAAAGSQASVKHVWATLVSNAVSVVVSAVGVAYVGWLLCDWRLTAVLCDDVISEEGKSECVHRLWLLDLVVTGLLSLTLVLLVLQFCVAATVGVFSGKSIRRRSSGGDGGVSMHDAGAQSPDSP